MENDVLIEGIPLGLRQKRALRGRCAHLFNAEANAGQYFARSRKHVGVFRIQPAGEAKLLLQS